MRRIIFAFFVILAIAYMSCTSPEPVAETAPATASAVPTATTVPTASIKPEEIENAFNMTAAAAARHILYLNKSEEYHGVLIGIAADGTVTFMTEKGEVKKFNRSEVERIEFTKPRKDDFAKNVKELPDGDVRKYFELNPTAEQYPASNYLTAFEHVDIDLTVPGKAVYEKAVLYKVLRKGGQYLNSWEFRYLADSEKFDVIYARSISGRKVKCDENGNQIVDNGGAILNLAENALEDGAVNSSIRAYDNLHKVKFALKGVDEGDWVNFCVRKEMKIDALHPLQIEEQFADFEPILKKVVYVHYSKGSKEFALTTIHNDMDHGLGHGPDRDTEIFSIENSKRVEMEQDLPPLRDIFPTLIISRPAAPAEFAAEFKKFLDAATPDEKTAAKFKEILKKYPGIPPAQAFYFHIQKEFDRVNIPPSDYSWKPHTIEEILNLGKGNSLDLAYLMCAMLRSINISSVIYLAAPSTIGPVFPEEGALADFSTPLLRVNWGGGPISATEYSPFLSLAGEFRSYGYLPSALQEVPCFSISSWKPNFGKTRKFEEFENARSTSIAAELSADGSIKVTKTIMTAGSYLEDIRGLSKLKPEELKLYFENMVSAIHSSAKLVSYKPDKAVLENRSEIPEIEVVYTIDNYALAAGNYLAFKLPEIDYTAWEISARERNFPMWWGYRNLEETEISVTVPDGWKIYYAGGGKSGKAGGEGISYDYSFSADGKTIKFKDGYSRHAISVPAAEYKQYLGCVDTRAAVAKELLVIEKE